MQIIGLAAIVLFLAALTFFMMAFWNPQWVNMGGVLGVLCLGLAAIMLAITIKKRNKTERV